MTRRQRIYVLIFSFTVIFGFVIAGVVEAVLGNPRRGGTFALIGVSLTIVYQGLTRGRRTKK